MASEKSITEKIADIFISRAEAPDLSPFHRSFRELEKEKRRILDSLDTSVLDDSEISRNTLRDTRATETGRIQKFVNDVQEKSAQESEFQSQLAKGLKPPNKVPELSDLDRERIELSLQEVDRWEEMGINREFVNAVRDKVDNSVRLGGRGDAYDSVANLVLKGDIPLTDQEGGIFWAITGQNLALGEVPRDRVDEITRDIRGRETIKWFFDFQSLKMKADKTGDPKDVEAVTKFFKNPVHPSDAPDDLIPLSPSQ